MGAVSVKKKKMKTLNRCMQSDVYQSMNPVRRDPSSRRGYAASPVLALAFQLDARDNDSLTEKNKTQPGPRRRHTGPRGVLRRTSGSMNRRSRCRVSSCGVWTDGAR